MDNVEMRVFPSVELRVVDDGQPKIEGYAAVFNELSGNLGGFVERIEPGFFSGCLGQDVRALWNHNPDIVLGRTMNGTLALSEDRHGLMVSIVPPDTQAGMDALASVRRGDVNQMSFAFTVAPKGDNWSTNDNGIRLRTLLPGGCAALYDVSPVTFPAYPQTSAQVRALVAGMDTGDPAEIALLDLQLRRLRLESLE